MSPSRFIFRGALGGVIGGPLFLIGLTLHDVYRLGYTPYGGFLQVMALPYMLAGGLIAGSLIGCMVWIIECKAKIHPPVIVRAVLGAALVFILTSLIQLLISERQGLTPPTRMEWFVNLVMFVTTLGSLPAIIALPSSSVPDE